MLGIALAGCSIAASHGLYGIVYRTLQLTGVLGTFIGILTGLLDVPFA